MEQIESTMRWEEQGATPGGRYVVVPRTLSFLLCDERVLLLRGAPNKRLWSGKWNGIGGHVERDEGVFQSALREIGEETGLQMTDLRLSGLVHVSGLKESSGVILFVYVGHVATDMVRAGDEGELAWFPLSVLPSEIVEDLPHLIPRVIEACARSTIVYGNYWADPEGNMVFAFDKL